MSIIFLKAILCNINQKRTLKEKIYLSSKLFIFIFLLYFPNTASYESISVRARPIKSIESIVSTIIKLVLKTVNIVSSTVLIIPKAPVTTPANKPKMPSCIPCSFVKIYRPLAAVEDIDVD